MSSDPTIIRIGTPILADIWLPSRLIGSRLTATGMRAVGIVVSPGFRQAGNRCTRGRVRRSSIEFGSITEGVLLQE